MADSVGSGFPSTGINKGHIFYDFDQSSMWMYLGGIPRLASSWEMLYGRLDGQPDTSLWGQAQTGALWSLVSDGKYYGWNGSSIIAIASGDNPNLYSYKTRISFQEDFLAQISSPYMTRSGGTQAAGAVSAGRVGITRISTTAVISTLVGYFMGSTVELVFNAGTTNFSVLWVLKPVTVDVTTQIRIGVMTAGGTSNPPTNGRYFEKLDADTTWFMVTRGNGAQSARVNTGIPVSTNFLDFEVRVNNNNTEFLINGTSFGIVSTDAMTGAVRPAVSLINSDAVDKSIDIDYMEIAITGLTR